MFPILRFKIFQRTASDDPLLRQRLALDCLAQHLGQPVSHDKILGDVCGCFPERGGTLEQVKSVVKRLRQKIEPEPHHPQYIISIKRIGYQLSSQAQWQAVMRES